MYNICMFIDVYIYMYSTGFVNTTNLATHHFFPTQNQFSSSLSHLTGFFGFCFCFCFCCCVIFFQLLLPLTTAQLPRLCYVRFKLYLHATTARRSESAQQPWQAQLRLRAIKSKISTRQLKVFKFKTQKFVARKQAKEQS